MCQQKIIAKAVHDDELVLKSDLSLEESSGMMVGNKDKEDDPEMIKEIRKRVVEMAKESADLGIL